MQKAHNGSLWDWLTEDASRAAGVGGRSRPCFGASRRLSLVQSRVASTHKKCRVYELAGAQCRVFARTGLQSRSTLPIRASGGEFESRGGVWGGHPSPIRSIKGSLKSLESVEICLERSTAGAAHAVHEACRERYIQTNRPCLRPPLFTCKPHRCHEDERPSL